MEDKRNLLIIIIAAIGLMAVAVVTTIVVYGFNADNKSAKTLSLAAEQFDNPSTVRLVSGEFSGGATPELFVVLSSEDSSGSTVTKRYKITYYSPDNIVILDRNEKDTDGDYDSLDIINVERVNKKLEKMFEE